MRRGGNSAARPPSTHDPTRPTARTAGGYRSWPGSWVVGHVEGERGIDRPTTICACESAVIINATTGAECVAAFTQTKLHPRWVIPAKALVLPSVILTEPVTLARIRMDMP